MNNCGTNMAWVQFPVSKLNESKLLNSAGTGVGNLMYSFIFL